MGLQRVEHNSTHAWVSFGISFQTYFWIQEESFFYHVFIIVIQQFIFPLYGGNGLAVLNLILLLVIDSPANVNSYFPL